MCKQVGATWPSDWEFGSETDKIAEKYVHEIYDGVRLSPQNHYTFAIVKSAIAKAIAESRAACTTL